MFSCGKIASVFLLVCTLYFGAVTAQTAGTNVATTVTTRSECWREEKAKYLQRRDLDCGPKTGQDRQNCIESYRIVPFQLKEACRQYKNDLLLSESRQSPVNLLLAYGILGADITTDTNSLEAFNGRQIIDSTSNNFIDFSAFAGVALTFDLQTDAASQNYYYTPATGNTATVTFNEGNYNLVRVDMKNPSEHVMSGRAGSAEIQYVFEKVLSTPTTEIDPDTELVVSFIVADFETSSSIITPAPCSGTGVAPFADFLNLSVSPTVTAAPSMVRYVIKYAGSQTVAPYTARSLWMVAVSWVNDPNGPSWTKGEWNYPDRPPVRALFSEGHMVKTSSGSPLENGCINFP